MPEKQMPEKQMPEKQQTVEIFVREDMDVYQRSELVAKLEHERGIARAYFEHGDHHRLVVVYNPGFFSRITLLDKIREDGFHGEAAGD